MSNLLIVDTDVLIDTSRGVQDAISCIRQLEQQSTVAISSITEMELIIGCRNKNELQSLGRFLKRFQMIKVSEPISDMATGLLTQYRLSHGLLIADALIAATAITLSVPFVSKNQRDYCFINKLNLLPYPNPLQSRTTV